MEFSNIFVVYDPTRADQPALDRARLIASETGSDVHVFACIFADVAKAEDKPLAVRELIARQKNVLLAASAALIDSGINVSTEVEWEKDWHQAVVRASIRNHADMVLKSSYKHSSSQRALNRTSDWTLIRECLCPVMLIKDDAEQPSRKVLAAVDIRADNDSYESLNQRIIEFSRRVMDNKHADVHFVNAHEELSSAPDRNTLIRSCGVASDNIHIRLGEPEDVIVESARSLNAGLVVVGNAARSGLSALINGNTVEKIVDRLECDVLSMP